jgi:hypothetical protein
MIIFTLAVADDTPELPREEIERQIAEFQRELAQQRQQIP